MNKKSGGVSYIEMLIALSLFSVLLMAALPLLNQAGRNLAYAQDGYEAHLAAQGIMLAVRDALGEASSLNISSAEATASAYAARIGTEGYSVWIFSENAAEISFGSPCVPAINLTLTGLSGMSFSGNTSVIVVVIWDEQLNITGRAVGVY